MKWNTDVFGNIYDNLKQARRRLDNLKKQGQTQANIRRQKVIQKEVDKLLEREEINNMASMFKGRMVAGG